MTNEWSWRTTVLITINSDIWLYLDPFVCNIHKLNDNPLKNIQIMFRTKTIRFNTRNTDSMKISKIEKNIILLQLLRLLIINQKIFFTYRQRIVYLFNNLFIKFISQNSQVNFIGNFQLLQQILTFPQNSRKVDSK